MQINKVHISVNKSTAKKVSTNHQNHKAANQVTLLLTWLY